MMFEFLGVAFKYLIAGGIGFFFGIIVTVFLMTKKNFETYQRISREVGEQYENGKNLYKAMTNGDSYDDDDDGEEYEDEDEETEDE